MAAPDLAAQNLYAETIALPRRERLAVSRAQLAETLLLVEAAMDLFASGIGFAATSYLVSVCWHAAHVTQSVPEIAGMSSFLAILVVLLLRRENTYQSDCGLLQLRETERIIRASVQSVALLQVAALLLDLPFSSAVFLFAVVFVPTLLILQKRIFLEFVRRSRFADTTMLRVVVYGAGETARTVISSLLASPRLMYQPIAVIDTHRSQSPCCLVPMGYRGRVCIPVLNDPLTPARLRSLDADLLLIASPNVSPEKLLAAQDTAKLAGIDIARLNGPGVTEQQNIASMNIDGLLFTTSFDQPRAGFEPAKRLMDVAISTVLLILITPLLFMISMLIRFDSPGPALFVQKRVGRDGLLFDFYKFRTMYVSSLKYELSPTTSRDRRITRIGRFLRRTSLDELPQLLNVLMGDMSLVGPRPEMPFIVERYNAQQRLRLRATPGITGLWQLSADRAFPIHHNVQYDLYYIRNRNLSMDAAIMIHTLFFATRGGI